MFPGDFGLRKHFSPLYKPCSSYNNLGDCSFAGMADWLCIFTHIVAMVVLFHETGESRGRGTAGHPICDSVCLCVCARAALDIITLFFSFSFLSGRNFIVFFPVLMYDSHHQTNRN